MALEKENRETMKSIKNSNHRSGFTLVEIMIVVAIIGMLAAIAIPNFVKARKASQGSACINNMRQIQGAKATWALENKKLGTDQVVTGDLFGAALYIKSAPKCPANETGNYVLGNVDDKVTCPNVGTEANHTLGNAY